ncbi:MAG: hypothetical protein PVG69_16285 [Desulfobacterales bacterium]
MKSKIFVRMMLAAFLFLFIFGGCGGGGGGSRDDDDNDGNGGLKYTGETAPAEIDQDNAIDIAAGAFVGGKTGTFQTETDLPVDNFRIFRVPQILGDTARSMDLRPYLHNLSLNTNAVYNQTGTIDGTCGGSYYYTVNKNDASGEFDGTIIFSYYCDHDRCVPINGEVDIEGRVDTDSGDIITITFWFDNLSDGTMTMDGEIFMDFSDSPIICTLDVLFEHETTAKVYWAKDYCLNISEYEANTTVEIFGTFYHPDYGYVTVDTGTGSGLFQIQPWSEFPWIGWLEMGGANGTKARLSAIYDNCQITADTDGDGFYDLDSGELNWPKPDLIDPENWMGNLGDQIKTLKIKNVVLPGTHDSNTDSKSWESDNWGQFQCGPASHPYLRAQNRSPRLQLEDGIRYFDLRYQWQGGGDELEVIGPYGMIIRPLVIWHGACHTTNGPIQNAITWVKEFVESHPKEIVILDLSHWSFMNEARHRAAAEYIVEKLGGYMVPWDIGPNPINFGSPEVTVQDLWEEKKNVIVIYHPDSKIPGTYDLHSDLDFAYGNLFWGGEFTAESIIVTPWPNVKRDDLLNRKMKAALNCRSEINDDLTCKPPDAHDKLFVLQSQRTTSNLERDAKVTNPKVIMWLQYWTTVGDLYPHLTPNISPQVALENLNIVIVDFYEFGGKDIHNSCQNKSFVETIVEMNLNRATLFE